MRLSYPKRIMLTMIIMLTALFLVMVALWLPSVKREVKIMDAMFVIDITDSMNVEDMLLDGNPVSRVIWARELVRLTLQDMPCGSHAGLAVFSQARSLILLNPVEVCSCYHTLTLMLNKVHPYMAWKRSSEVSKAVYTAIRQVKNINPQPSIVFFTDGHEAPPLNEKLFPKFVGKPGEVRGLMVGVGGNKPMPIPKSNKDGEIEGFWEENEVMHQSVYASDDADTVIQQQRTEHLSSHKKAHLQTLADRVGFNYVASPKKPGKLLFAMNKQAKTRPQIIDYDLFSWFAKGALGLFLLVYLPYGRFIKTND